MAGSYGSSVLFLRPFPTVSPSGYTNLHSDQQGTRFPFSPMASPEQVIPVFLITANPTGVRWYLIVVLMCSYLRIGDFDPSFG